MACFIVPAAEALVISAAALFARKYEKSKTPIEIRTGSLQTPGDTQEKKTGFARRLFWLASLLWGGAALLAFEHLWHGEVLPYFPFLTAATEGPQAVSEMLHEMATVGVTMAILVTVIWAIMVAVSYAIEKRPVQEKAEVTV